MLIDYKYIFFRQQRRKNTCDIYCNAQNQDGPRGLCLPSGMVTTIIDNQYYKYKKFMNENQRIKPNPDIEYNYICHYIFSMSTSFYRVINDTNDT